MIVYTNSFSSNQEQQMKRRKVWTDDTIAMLHARYIHEGAHLLAQELGVKPYVIQNKAGLLGLHTKVGYARVGAERAANNKSYDLTYFDIWTPNMAYILGFLFADGNISKNLGSVSVNLVASDRCVLDFIHSELKCVIPVRTKSGYGRDKPQASIGIHSKIIARRLVKLGMKPRKTYNDDPFPEVPDSMMPHFIRGDFDGDGCARRSVSFIGSHKFIVGIRDALVRLAGMTESSIHLCEGKTATTATVEWSQKRDVEKFRRFIYPSNDYFCLLRKRDKVDASLAMRVRDRQKIFWTPEQENLVLESFQTLGPKRLGELLGIPPSLVCYKARKLGIPPITHKQRGQIIQHNHLKTSNNQIKDRPDAKVQPPVK